MKSELVYLEAGFPLNHNTSSQPSTALAEAATPAIPAAPIPPTLQNLPSTWWETCWFKEWERVARHN